MLQIVRGVYFFFKKLISVDLVGGFHQIITSLHLESLKSEMNNEINRSTKFSPLLFPPESSSYDSGWNRIATRLSTTGNQGGTGMALWKAKLGEEEEDCSV